MRPRDFGSALPARALLRQEVTDRIKTYIIDNKLKPGDPLPTEAELCEALNASRSSLREAIKSLTALDIVEVRHGSGTFVGRLSLSALVESLAFRGLLNAKDDVRVLLDLVDVRQVLEQGMAAQIVDHLDHGHLHDLERLVVELEQCTDDAGLIATDRAFHQLLVAPLGNELVEQLTAAFWDVHAIVARHLEEPGRGEREETVRAHRAMVAAVRAKDAAAFSAAVVAHYSPVRRRISTAAARD
jgi:DNA-binding FadR family transcriptional regulator